jgi:adenine-specific DNA-methyltransferase
VKKFASESEGMTSWTWWPNSEVGHNQEATKELNDLIGQAGVFDNPKPQRLLKRMLQLSTDSDCDDLVLDFFAGSGTTAHAVLEVNKEDNGNRRFILVQLPEPAGREDFPTISAITRERVRRAAAKLNEAEAGNLPLFDGLKQDRGFKAFRLAESNFKAWQAQMERDPAKLEEQLELHIDHIRHGRSAQDIFYELLLKSGFPLTASVETLTLAGKTVYSVAGGAFLLCLDQGLTLEVIRAMADRKPERVVCLDAGFAGNDQLKANAVQIFKTKGVTSFKTV